MRHIKTVVHQAKLVREQQNLYFLNLGFKKYLQIHFVANI